MSRQQEREDRKEDSMCSKENDRGNREKKSDRERDGGGRETEEGGNGGVGQKNT